MTGGAIGSIVGQLFHLTAAQRAQSAGGRSGSGDERRVRHAGGRRPCSASSCSPSSSGPARWSSSGLAAAAADGLRMVMASAGLISAQLIFPVPPHAPLGGVVLLGAVAVGLATGFAAWLMTQAVYRSEDLFKKLTGHVHWMWWPMIGGLIIGMGGLVDPRALGVGYDTIHAELLGQLGVKGPALCCSW